MKNVNKLKKPLAITSIAAIGAAILFFLVVLALQLFAHISILKYELKNPVWKIIILLMIAGFGSMLLITSINIWNGNRALSVTSGVLVVLAAILSVLRFVININNVFLLDVTLDGIILSVCVNFYTAKYVKCGNKNNVLTYISAGISAVIAIILLLTVHAGEGFMGKAWESSVFIFLFVVLALSYLGLTITVGVLAKGISKNDADEAVENKQSVTISKSEYERLLDIEKRYNELKK